jgi:diadenosine tetraphosphate (Ap4A) HIT family hydrolase
VALDGCVPCARAAAAGPPPSEAIAERGGWRVVHAFGTSLPGWLVVLPRRHLLALDELDDDEAAALGPLLRDVTAALRAVVGASKTYVALFAEAEGFAHLHLHVVPRQHDLPAELRGPAIFGLLGADLVVPDAEALSLRLRTFLTGLTRAD